MRVFLTGATGYIGSAVAPALRERGHDVAALVRPETDSKALRDLGVVIVAGDLASLPTLADSLGSYDAILHIAQSNSADAPALNRIALDVFTAQQAFLVYTSGVWVCGNTGFDVADESTPPDPLPIVAWRPEQEQAALATGRSAVIRPGCVYGGKQSLCAGWFESAEQKKPVYLVGDGNNQWAMVNLHDLADCYVRITEQRATGIFHAVDDTNETLLGCALAVAAGLRHRNDPHRNRPREIRPLRRRPRHRPARLQQSHAPETRLESEARFHRLARRAVGGVESGAGVASITTDSPQANRRQAACSR